MKISQALLALVFFASFGTVSLSAMGAQDKIPADNNQQKIAIIGAPNAPLLKNIINTFKPCCSPTIISPAQCGKCLGISCLGAAAGRMYELAILGCTSRESYYRLMTMEEDDACCNRCNQGPCYCTDQLIFLKLPFIGIADFNCCYFCEMSSAVLAPWVGGSAGCLVFCCK